MEKVNGEIFAATEAPSLQVRNRAPGFQPIRVFRLAGCLPLHYLWRSPCFPFRHRRSWLPRLVHAPPGGIKKARASARALRYPKFYAA
jgi:hypothetical protein